MLWKAYKALGAEIKFKPCKGLTSPETASTVLVSLYFTFAVVLYKNFILSDNFFFKHINS